MKKEFVGRNVQQAIEKGLKELGKSQEDVDIKIIDQGGFFKKAKVELIYEDAVEENIKEEENVKIKEETKKEKQAKCKCEENKKSTKKCTCQEEQCNCDNKDCDCEIDEDKVISAGKEFLNGLFDSMNITNEISTVNTERGICFVINGDNVNELIGYRGETLNSLQFLLNIIVKNKTGISTRVLLDIENYKSRRETTLIALAERLAGKAIKTHKPVRLEPMSAYERRIIHTALQSNDKVITKSEGNEPNRRLFIIPKK